MLDSVVDHLIHNVLPSATDYDVAEDGLSRAIATNLTPAAWESAARLAKRRAAELAIAIDGLTDRCAGALGLSKTSVRASVAGYCSSRHDCIERVRGVANAYKHANLTDPTLPITSENDVLVVALGYGVEGYGVGKFDGYEVVVRDKAGEPWKFLGDAPAAISGWFRFLQSQGAMLPSSPIKVCGIDVHP